MTRTCINTTAINKQDNAGHQKHHKNKFKNNKIAKEIITSSALESNLNILDDHDKNLFPKEHEN